jgi:hypothetical protein
MLQKKIVSTKAPRRSDPLLPEVFAMIEKDMIQKRIPYEKKEKWVNNDRPVAFAANKECKTQTKNPLVSNGKIACHEQTRATSNCNFDRGQGTHMHQQSETVEDWTNGELSSTQLLHQLLASAEMEDGWSPVRPERCWTKQREKSTFQSRNHQPSNTSSNKYHFRKHFERSQQPHRAEQHVLRRQKFFHHMRGVALIASLPSIWLCLAEVTLAVGVVWNRDTGQVFAQVLNFLLPGVRSTWHLTNLERIRPIKVT